MAAIFLSLSVVICAMWIRSHWVGDDLGWSTLGEATQFGSASGVLYLEKSGGWSKDPRDNQPSQWSHVSGRSVSVSSNAWDGIRLFGFAWVRDSLAGKPNSSPSYHWFVSIPYWFLWCASLAYPTWWTVRRREAVLRLFRSPVGTCKSCGYDLRATPARCPECGELTAVSEGGKSAVSNRTLELETIVCRDKR